LHCEGKLGEEVIVPARKDRPALETHVLPAEQVRGRMYTVNNSWTIRIPTLTSRFAVTLGCRARHKRDEVRIEELGHPYVAGELDIVNQTRFTVEQRGKGSRNQR
jgi:hypothetical protein